MTSAQAASSLERTDAGPSLISGTSMDRLAPSPETAICILICIGGIMRALLVIGSPQPYGYVWDFYEEGTRVLYFEGRLPIATDCWQCYHPPLFYLTTYPLYALGQLIDHGRDSIASSFLAALVAVPSSLVVIYVGFRLLQAIGYRQLSLLIGATLIAAVPALYVASFGAEADILLAALLVIFTLALTRDYAIDYPRSLAPAIRVGVLCGLAAATKYSGLVAIVSAILWLGYLGVRTGKWRRAVNHGLVMLGFCVVLGGWRFGDNLMRYGDPMYANGSAADGFSVTRPSRFDRYEFLSLRFGDLYDAFRPESGREALTRLPAYRSVPTALLALTWTDMSFFSVKGRHGDSRQPYPDKDLSPLLATALVFLGWSVSVVAAFGVTQLARHPRARPSLVVAAATLAVYMWWFTGQETWALKTKYLLFLLPTYAACVVAGLSGISRRSLVAGRICLAVTVLTVIVALAYQLLFALL